MLFVEICGMTEQRVVSAKLVATAPVFAKAPSVMIAKRRTIRHGEPLTANSAYTKITLAAR